ncbi:MAG: hypothetical protein ACO3UU_15425, partial [Minisyncoccia bacterium]
MYVKACVVVSKFDADFTKDEDTKNNIMQALNTIKNIPCIPDGMKKEDNFLIESTVARWRKANQIHKWFVDNVMSGVDECQTVYINRKNIKTIINLCEKVLETPQLAESLLPTGSGFFFGSTEYDDYYFQDLKDTIMMLSPLLEKEFDNCYFSYR